MMKKENIIILYSINIVKIIIQRIAIIVHVLLLRLYMVKIL